MRPRSIRSACTAAWLSLLCAAAVPAAAPATRDHIEVWPQGRRDTLLRPDVEHFVDRLLSKLTLEEKIGQMIQADIDWIRPEDLRDYKLGAVLAGGNDAPGGNVRSAPSDWLALVDAFARAAQSGGNAAHPPIPLLFGIDAVHGYARLGGATIFPHNIGLGAAHDPELLTRIGRVTAAEVATTGIDWIFAPTLAVVRDARWGRTYESYSEDPTLVARYAAAMVTGLQGALGTSEFMAAGHTLASAKHFLGDGGTNEGRDQFDNHSTPGEFARIHAAGYPPAIAAGVLTVMASYSSWRGVKMQANRELLTDVLKDRFGFNGFVVGDWNAHEEIPGCSKFDCPLVIRAGLDMFMAPDGWKRLYRNTLREARSGAIPMTRIDDAVRRILRAKALAGLFERPFPAQRPEAGRFDLLGSAAHRAIAREAVRKSLVLLKNDGDLLPLSPRAHVLVAGPAADDIGRQAGGWTIDWQGAHSRNADFPGATSIFVGLRAALEAGGGSAELGIDGRYAQRPDAAIVVFGEEPYAEFQGDRETLEFSPGDKRDLELMRRLRAAGIPVVGVFLSGRPMWVNPELNAAAGFVAAWLPGSEGEGVADLLIRGPDGQIRYDFTGRLSFSWPGSPMPARFADGDQPIGAVFARGFGLDYAHHTTAPRFSETLALPADRHGANVLFAAGRVTAPWSVVVSDSTAEVRLTTRRQVSPAGVLAAALGGLSLSGNWNGGGRGVLAIGGRPIDLRVLVDGGEALRIRWRVNARPAGPVRLGIRCAAPSGAEIPSVTLSADEWHHCRAPVAPSFDVTRWARNAPAGRWSDFVLPLACFARLGADLSSVEAPVALASDSRLSIDIRDIRFVRPDRLPACPAE